jgi:hypothetical protein
MLTGIDVNKLHVDANALCKSAYAAFHHMLDSEFTASRCGIKDRPSSASSMVLGADLKLVEARQFGDDVGGDAVAEIALGRIVAEIGEGEDDDGWFLLKLHISTL